MMRYLASIFLTLAIASLPFSSVHAEKSDDFFKGKQIDLIVSSSPGGGFDAYARLVARHLGNHIPGHPTIVVENMAGAGGLRAANFLYSNAPRDGTSILLMQNTVPLEPLYGDTHAKFDAEKFNWLGSPSQETAVFAIWRTSPVNSIEDAQKHVLVIGAPGSSSSPAFYARLFAYLFDLNLKVLAGYPGEAEATHGMETGENDGNTSAYWSSLKATKGDWIKANKLKFLLQYGARPLPALKGTPFALDLISDPLKREIMQIASAPLAIGRPIAAPPGLSSDRVEILRNAISATFKDRQYQLDCSKVHLECDQPVTGDKVSFFIDHAYKASPDAVKKIREIYQAGAAH